MQKFPHTSCRSTLISKVDKDQFLHKKGADINQYLIT